MTTINAIRPCVHIECLIAITGQNAYMHEQVTKEFAEKKYLNECTDFGYVSLWDGGCRKNCLIFHDFIPPENSAADNEWTFQLVCSTLILNINFEC